MRKYLIFILLCVCATSFAQPPADLQIERNRVHLKCRHRAPHRGIRRCVEYHLTSSQIPKSFDGFRIAFVTDTHYKSRFNEKTLAFLGNMLRELNPDLILLGGDYQEGCEYVRPLFQEIMSCKPTYGAAAIMGNNDFERCTELIYNEMQSAGIRMVENKVDTIIKDGSSIYVVGAHNNFRGKETTPCVANRLNNNDFAILITHTPDYAEDVDITNIDFALAGHTHGGQVTLFGLYAPVVPSHYGQRFLKGLRYTSAGVPMLISRGIGTSRKDVRLFAPAEIHLLTLHSK
ncbi:MAG: metallophosphoesterase [Bacteroidales bacterium]|nr:metallophosphoesterase [Bacteroidales bacterium]